MSVRRVLARRLARLAHRMPRTSRRFLLDHLAGGAVAERFSAGLTECRQLENGLTIVINPLLHGALFANGEFGYERNVVALLKDFLIKGSIFFDVGANVGIFSLLAANIVGDSGHVYAFEPEPNNIDCFRKSLERNHTDNVTLLAFAVGDRDGTMTFDRKGGAFSGRLVARAGSADSSRKMKVEVHALDSLVSRSVCAPPTFCKIDVEGGEGDVLLGSKEVLQEHRPIMLVEMHDDNPDGMRLAYEVMNAFEYDLFSVDRIGSGGAREPLDAQSRHTRHVLALPRSESPNRRPD